MLQMSKAVLIDHTNLSPIARKEDIVHLCGEAVAYNFASVCVLPYYVPLAVRRLQGTNVMVCTVVGFPLGGQEKDTKVYEAKLAVEQGASEIDMVINLAALKNGDYDYVGHDIASVVEAVAPAKVKVIIEACYLDVEEKKLACRAAVLAGAAFVKTSTGMAKGGAKVEDVRLMRQVVGEEIGVKAAGGIGTMKEMEAMLAAGANRIGTSSGIAIMEQYLAAANDKKAM